MRRSLPQTPLLLLLIFIAVGAAVFVWRSVNKSQEPRSGPTISKPVKLVYCQEPRPEVCTMELRTPPPYICGSDGKAYGNTCQACSQPNVKSYTLQNKPCVSGQQSEAIPFGMRFPPLEAICDYQVVTFWRDDLLDSQGRFKPELLEKASSCDTQVVVRLHGQTRDILADDGLGLDLVKYEARISDFAGRLDHYVDNSTILAHVAIDEPHDCSDWGGKCPTPEEVEQAALISKKYWPNLLTLVSTIPRNAAKHTWKDVDIINFQYAFHKGK